MVKLKVQDILEAAYELRSEVVICLLGQPGIGKSQGVYDFAKAKGVNVVEIIASQILPNEVSGITMPDQDTKSMEVYDHARLASLKDGDILFFDELLQAAPSTLSACLTLIQERKMLSGRKLPDIMIVAAANPLNSAEMIPLSIRQRFMFYEIQFDMDEWVEYVEKNIGAKPTDGLKKMIRTSGSDWNVPTPRTTTKLLQWYGNAKTEQQREDIYDSIGHMFDFVYANEIKKSCVASSPKQQILNAVKQYSPATYSELEQKVFLNGVDNSKFNIGIKVMNDDGSVNMDNVTVEEIVQILSGFENWDEILASLDEIEMEE